jgi:hypothetical protein
VIYKDSDPIPSAKDFGAPGGARLVKFCKSGRKFKRLKAIEGYVSPYWVGGGKPVPPRYTVTLRRTQRAPGRNSNEAVWRDFARGIGARVIPDYEDEPIHMHDRMALYAGAEMNFFCSNGPGILCSLSPYPCMMFNTHHARESLIGDGMKEGEQYPWMLPNQRAIWEEATGASLMRHFLHWRETGGFL